MNHIGLFFYVKDQVYTKTYALQEAIPQGGFLVPPEGHDRVWREKYEVQEGTSYDHWPRGRVAYNTTSRSYCMYHDGCLSEAILAQAKEAFGIQEAVVRYVKDDYYTCHECMKKLSDDDDFLDSF
ncbi:MAG: hypothetical protein ACRDDX_05645 [Cellulosilyticaceae bacterium]